MEFYIMRKLLLGSFIATAMLGQQAFAGTESGTVISNTATANYTIGAANSPVTQSVSSVINVDEIIDISGGITTASTDAQTPNAVLINTHTLENTGNGDETFSIQVSDSDWTTAVYIESNPIPNGYDALDTPVTTQLFNKDQEYTFYTVTTIPGTAVEGDDSTVELTVVSDTVYSDFNTITTAGNIIAGAGTNKLNATGIDAIVGSSTARYTSSTVFTVSDITLSAFTKTASAAVHPLLGTVGQIPGAVVTYDISFTLAGTADADSFTITDAIPSDLTYVPNSVIVDAVPFTDGDTNSGVTVTYIGSTITVTFGTLTAGDHTITLEALID
jgi:uncharacterized repeat protein (TIGR01451 family)